VKQITGSSQLVGLLGWPVSHSHSPAMHNAAAAALGLDLVYVPLPVESSRIDAAISGLVALGFLGANVTVPHKETVVPLMDRLDRSAAVIGAVNTIVMDRNPDAGDSEVVVSGFNTDWKGFLSDLEAMGWDPKGKKCLILGAGGSARAVSYALATAQAQAAVVSRRTEQARGLVQDVEAGVGAHFLQHVDFQDLGDFCQEVHLDLVVNATPIGMLPNDKDSPWPHGLSFPKSALIYDLVYQPAETLLMRQARAAGCEAANGLGMLVQQGVESFELWTGKKPNAEIMAAALE
jgi:shikimate dehydrogenase